MAVDSFCSFTSFLSMFDIKIYSCLTHQKGITPCNVSHVVDIIHGIGGDSHWSVSSISGLWLAVGVHQTSQLCGPLPICVDNLHRVVFSQGVALITILIVAAQGGLTSPHEWVVITVIPPLKLLVTWVPIVTGLPPDAAPAINTAVVITPEHITHYNWDISWHWPDGQVTGQVYTL